MWCLPQHLRCQSQNEKVYCKTKQNSKNGSQYPFSVSIMFVPFVGSVGGFIYVALDSSRCDWDCDVNVFLW